MVYLLCFFVLYFIDTVAEVQPAASLLTPPMSPVEVDQNSTTPFPELMSTPAPVQMGSSDLAPITISRLQDFTAHPRPVDLAAWQAVMLAEAFRADRGQPNTGRLRDLAQRTHLPVSIINVSKVLSLSRH